MKIMPLTTKSPCIKKTTPFFSKASAWLILDILCNPIRKPSPVGTCVMDQNIGIIWKSFDFHHDEGPKYS